MLSAKFSDMKNTNILKCRYSPNTSCILTPTFIYLQFLFATHFAPVIFKLHIPIAS